MSVCLHLWKHARRVKGAVFFALLYFLLTSETGVSQSNRAGLRELQARLVSLQGCASTKQTSTLWRGLSGGWSVAPRRFAPLPQDYIESLSRDVRACDAVSGLQNESLRTQVLHAISTDIDTKIRDCRMFGMGRLVAVRVTTVRDAKIENGWEAFYRWSCASPFDTEELRIPGLTSPAVIELPPGEYIFRAQKRASASEILRTDPVTIVVGLKESMDCPLPTP